MALQFAAGHQMPLLPSLTTDTTATIAIPQILESFQTSLKSSLPTSESFPIVDNVNFWPDYTSSTRPSRPDTNKSRTWSWLPAIISSIYEHFTWDNILSILLASQSPSAESSSDYNSHNYTATIASIVAPSDDDERLRHIPDYVLEYAPYCHLYSEEEYWPGLMEEHLEHTTPKINYDPVPEEYQRPNLNNLNRLNQFKRVYLTSNDDPETYPDWLSGEDNIPELLTNPHARRQKRTARPFDDESQPHKSSAPAILVVVDKGEFVDAFWFFFYSFNLGNQVLGVRFGNHVADWEHTAVRFKDGKPAEVFYSEHEWGAAYRWEDAEKYARNSKRMLTYSAYGTHAMYRTAGIQRYILPFGLLQDTTDKGPLWDPTLNMYAYTYDPYNDIVRASNLTPQAPEEWFHYQGKWGDKYYPMDDPRQYRFLGELHYSSGPTGPKFKNLGRSHICQNEDTCIIKTGLDAEPPRIITAEEWERWRSRRQNEE